MIMTASTVLEDKRRRCSGMFSMFFTACADFKFVEFYIITLLSDSVSCDVTDTPNEMIKDGPTDTGHPDHPENNSSPADSGQGTAHVQMEQYSNTISPGHQAASELRKELPYASSGNDIFGSGDSDLEQFYRMSAQRFHGPGVGHEGQYDDLPLSFAFPTSEDDSSKVYSCNICNFKTAFKNSLVNHQAVHSDARPWICDICDYAAKRKQDLKKHLQTMHGMIVDSLALKPGVNPPASSTSSSGLASPVDVKPVIVNNVVVTGTDHSSGLAGFGGPLAVSSASLLAQQQAALGLGQPLPSSAKMSQISRSLPMPVVGQFIADKFPFNQFCGEGGMTSRGMPRFSTDTFAHRFPSGFRAESDSDSTDRVASGSDDFSSQRLHEHGNQVSGQSLVKKLHHRNPGLDDDGEDGQLPSVREMLSKNREQHHSVLDEPVARRRPESGTRHSDMSSSEAETKSNAHSHPSSAATAFSTQDEEMELMQRRKRISLESSGDRISGSDPSSVPAKVTRFQSPLSDSDRSPHVSSQSDHSGSIETISSTVSHSCALETKKSFHCVHCDILFFENALYLMHMGLHDNHNPWKCSICGRTFFEKYSFTSHFINQH